MSSDATAIVYAIISALLFAVTFLFRKQAVQFIPIQLAFLIESVFYLIIPLILFFILPSAVRKAAMQSTNGIIYACFAGIFVVAGVSLNYLALKGGLLSKIISITSPAQIIFGVLLGLLLLKDTLNTSQMIGVLLGIVSVILVSR